MTSGNAPSSKLILVNGPPGVGKSALAARYLADHPLALQVEIDSIRMALGQWATCDESKVTARALAITMAESHLQAGHDVVIPQYLGRIEFIETLQQLSERCDADFVEVLVLDRPDVVVHRFRQRRAALATHDQAHPEFDIDDAVIDQEIMAAFDRLRTITTERTCTHVIDARSELEDTYRELLRQVREA